MKSSSKQYRNLCSFLILLIHTSAKVLARSQFSSHVSVNTPARSYSHGVGDPLPAVSRRATYHQKPFQHKSSFNFRRPSSQNHNGGYPRTRPTIPFNNEERPFNNNFKSSPWHLNNFQEVNIPILPPSPYKVDSPDPESLWPEGLFLPPIKPFKLDSGLTGRRSDNDADSDIDPYLIEGTEAIAAVKRARGHGLLYFHDIPHINSLLANQELRQTNNLKPHRLGSLRHTWPYYRP